MNKTITIFDDDSAPVVMFPAPADKFVARELWCFLVDNLQPGFTVQLAIQDSAGDDAAELVRRSGQKVTPELYASLMDGTWPEGGTTPAELNEAEQDALSSAYRLLLDAGRQRRQRLQDDSSTAEESE